MPRPDGTPTLEELLLGGGEGALPFQAIRVPGSGVWILDKKDGKFTTDAPVIPEAAVKPADRWQTEQDPNTKSYFLVNRTTGERKLLSAYSPPSLPTKDDIKLLDTIDLPDGSKRVVYRFGTDIQSFTVPKDKTPFKLGRLQERNGLHFLEVAEGQFQLLPKQYQPSVIEDKGRFFIQQPNGQRELLPREYEAGLKDLGGRSFIQQPNGALQLLPGEGGVVTQDGRQFIKQPDGNLTPLAPRTSNTVMDQIIAEAIINGDMDKALAYQDFRDRPTEKESLDNALAFARSPTDQQVIAALARGDQVVEQRPSGPTRVGPQPDFLIQAFNRFKAKEMAGRAPTGEESQFYLGLPQRRQEAKQALDEAKLSKENAAAVAATASAWMAGLKTQSQLDQLKVEVDALNKKPAAAPTAKNTTVVGNVTPATGLMGGKVFALGGDPGSLVTASYLEQARANQLAAQQAEYDQANAVGLAENARINAASTDNRELSSDLLSDTPSFQATAANPTADTVDTLADLAGPTTQGDWSYSPDTGWSPNFAKGGIATGSNLEVVGEEGPELVDLPPGTRVIPFNKLSQFEVQALRRRGIRGFQAGGITFDTLTNTSQFPFDVRQLQSGTAIRPPRGNLFRAAGLQLPSAQALQNMTPTSLAFFRELGTQAGIPPPEFEQELNLGLPGGGRVRSPLMLPFLGRRG